MSLKKDLDAAIEKLTGLYDLLTMFAWYTADGAHALGTADAFLSAANDLREAINLLESVRDDEVLIERAAEEDSSGTGGVRWLKFRRFPRLAGSRTRSREGSGAPLTRAAATVTALAPGET
jgi:hypothetical protein